MTAAAEIPPTWYTPGLHPWGRAFDGYIGVCMQNTHGAVEYRVHQQTGKGILVIHAPTCVEGWADQIVMHCPVGGGLCFEGTSEHAYRELIAPLLETDDTRRVLDKLAEIHDGYFRRPA